MDREYNLKFSADAKKYFKNSEKEIDTCWIK